MRNPLPYGTVGIVWWAIQQHYPRLSIQNIEHTIYEDSTTHHDTNVTVAYNVTFTDSNIILKHQT